MSTKVERQLRRLPHLCLLMFFLLAITHARGQSVPTPFGGDVLSCSPAPCVLPPTQGSVGGYSVLDAAIASNPINRKELLLGGNDLNCPNGGSNAFYLSTDGGTNWTRTLCMHNVAFGNNAYYPAASPMVGYDLKGQAYAAGEYFDNKGIGFGLVLVQKSTDGVNWSERLALALGGTFGGFYYS